MGAPLVPANENGLDIAGVHGERFVVGTMSMQGVILKTGAAPETITEEFLAWVPSVMRDTFGLTIGAPAGWEDWTKIFHKTAGLFDKPIILFIDEFDSLPPAVIDRLVTLFRDMYLNRREYLLHGLSLIGVRAVLGVESLRGSPFNIQRSLHVPNFTPEEVTELFRQYQAESGEIVDPVVVEAVYGATRGQPGLVCWFGELLTETYHPGAGKIIGLEDWKRAYRKASRVEWNSTLLNLIQKAKIRYPERLLELFSRPNIPFAIRSEWCAYFYLNGIIDYAVIRDDIEVCVFSSPFVRENLYDALAEDLVGDRFPLSPLEPLADLADVFSGPEVDVPALLERYKAYLVRLKARGLNPWKDQPRRADFHLTEAVGYLAEM